ncbi:hypothetical protein ACSLPA_33945, partial [Escherichia coli]
MHFRVTGEWNGEPFNRVIEAENISDCYDHWMLFIAAIHFFALNVSGSPFCWVGAVAFRKCYLPLKCRLKEL